jgi:hypothetical protein
MIFMTAQGGKQLKHPLMDQWIVYNGTYSAINKKEILPYVTTCMTVKDYTKGNKPVTEGQTLPDSTREVFQVSKKQRAKCW